jgi:hypothetical protein
MDELYIVVVPNYWGKGKTIQEAKKNCREAGFYGRMTRYRVFKVHPSTTIDGMGMLCYPAEHPAVEIESVGISKKK